MAELTGRALARVARRTALLQATWNYERQQGLGWAYCLAPVLRQLYPDPAVRRERLAEHTAYFNTQPTMASLALGAVAYLEERRAAGEGPDGEGVARVKAVLGAALAALGDRLFWSTLRPFAAALGAWVALGGSPWGAAVLLVAYNALHLPLRFAGVGWGYRAGPAVLSQGLRERLERLVHRLSILGAALIGILVASLLVPHGEPQSLTFQATLAGGLGFGLISAQRARPSPTQWGLGVGVLCVVAGWTR
jgi:PTS system mannose-specific IID component